MIFYEYEGSLTQKGWCRFCKKGFSKNNICWCRDEQMQRKTFFLFRPKVVFLANCATFCKTSVGTKFIVIWVSFQSILWNNSSSFSFSLPLSLSLFLSPSLCFSLYSLVIRPLFLPLHSIAPLLPLPLSFSHFHCLPLLPFVSLFSPYLSFIFFILSSLLTS